MAIDRITKRYIAPALGVSAAGAILAEGAADIGQAVSAFGQRMRARDQNREFQQAQNTYTKQMLTFDESAVSRTGDKAAGLTVDYETQHKRAINDIAKGMQDPQSSHAFSQWAQDQYNRGHLSWTKREHAETDRAAQATWSAGLQGFEQRAELTPYDLGGVVQDADLHFAQAVEAGFMTKEEAAAKLSTFKEGLTGHALENAFAQDWRRVEKELQSDQWAVNAKTKAAFLDRAKTQRQKIKEQGNRAAQDILSGAGDAEAYFLETGDSSALTKIESDLRTIGKKGEADEFAKRRRISEKAQSVIRDGGDKPLLDQWNFVQKALAVDSPENATFKSRAKAQAEKVVKARIEAFQQDPAASVAKMVDQTMPPERQAARRIELQKEMGQGLKFKPRVLTTEEAAAYKDAWSGADADGKLDMLTRINAFGKHRAAVLEQAGVPGSTQIAASMFWDNPMAKGDARALIAAATAKPADIPENGVKDADVLRKLADSGVMQALRTVARNQPGNVRFQGYVAEMEKTLINAAKISGNKDAAKNLLDKHFQSIVDDTTAVFFSSGKVPDKSALDRAFRSKRQTIGSALEYQRAQSATAGMPSAAFDERIRTISDNGIWINAPDGEGFILLNPLSGRGITTKGGDYFRIRFDEIQDWSGKHAPYRGETGGENWGVGDELFNS